MSDPYERLMQMCDALAVIEHSPEAVAQKAAPKVSAAIEEQFALGLDPYGAPWAPLADSTLKKHGPPPLTDTGEMRGETGAVAAGKTIVASSPEPADFHQHGTRTMPARPVLPSEQQGLPQSWERAIKDAQAEVEAEIQKRVNAA